MTSGDAPIASNASLVGVEWIVEDINGRRVIDNARATLMFGADGRLSGDTSCNRYFADYQVNGASLEFGHPGATKRACVPAVMDQEQRFLEVLNAVDRYDIDDTNALVLYTPVGDKITARRLTGSDE